MLGRLLLRRTGITGFETYIYRRHLDSFSQEKNACRELRSEYTLLTCRSDQTLLPFKRGTKLAALPTDRWFDRGAICLVLEKDGQLAAYAWLHRTCYDNLGQTGTLNLLKNEAFIGPVFTDTRHRKKGLYYYLMNLSLDRLKAEGIATAFGTSNSKNNATIKVLIRKGFDLIGIVRSSGRKKKIILELTRENLVQTRLD